VREASNEICAGIVIFDTKEKEVCRMTGV